MSAENGYSYTMNNLIALDQQLNALLGGSPDETLSSRTYRRSQSNQGWRVAEKVIDILFFFDKGKNGEGHCELAYLVEMAHGHMPKAMVRDMLI